MIRFKERFLLLFHLLLHFFTIGLLCLFDPLMVLFHGLFGVFNLCLDLLHGVTEVKGGGGEGADC